MFPQEAARTDRSAASTAAAPVRGRHASGEQRRKGAERKGARAAKAGARSAMPCVKGPTPAGIGRPRRRLHTAVLGRCKHWQGTGHQDSQHSKPPDRGGGPYPHWCKHRQAQAGHAQAVWNAANCMRAAARAPGHQNRRPGLGHRAPSRTRKPQRFECRDAPDRCRRDSSLRGGEAELETGMQGCGRFGLGLRS